MKELIIEPLDLVICGVGGQGNVLASQVLGRAMLDMGYTVTVGETYGLSQRGGPVMSQVRITRHNTTGPLIPENQATAIISLEPLEALRVIPTYGHPEVIVFTNDRPLYPLGVIAGEAKYPEPDELKATLAGLCKTLHWLPATDEAMKIGSPILANVIIMAAVVASGLLPITADDLEDALSQMFPEEKMPANREAMKIGGNLL